MKPHPIELAVVAGIAVAIAIRTLLVALIALGLLLAGWRPSAAAPAPAPAPDPAADRRPALEALTVAQLRRQGRALGLPRTLTRTGRKAQLVEALAMA